MSSKLKKIDNIYYCVLSSSTSEQEAKMAEGFMSLLPLSGFSRVRGPWRPLLLKSRYHMPNGYSLLFRLYYLCQGGYVTTGDYVLFPK